MLLDVRDRRAHVLGEDVDGRAGKQRLGAIEMAQAVYRAGFAPTVRQQAKFDEHSLEGVREIVYRLAVRAAEDVAIWLVVFGDLLESLQIVRCPYFAHDRPRPSLRRRRYLDH